jgi:hypothetical protein
MDLFGILRMLVCLDQDQLLMRSMSNRRRADAYGSTSANRPPRSFLLVSGVLKALNRSLAFDAGHHFRPWQWVLPVMNKVHKFHASSAGIRTAPTPLKAFCWFH